MALGAVGRHYRTYRCVERTVVRWLAEAIGCEGFGGSLTSGGSLSNLMALALAREAHAPANEDGARGGVVYASDEVHMAIPKAVALLGIGTQTSAGSRSTTPFV